MRTCRGFPIEWLCGADNQGHMALRLVSPGTLSWLARQIKGIMMEKARRGERFPTDLEASASRSALVRFPMRCSSSMRYTWLLLCTPYRACCCCCCCCCLYQQVGGLRTQKGSIESPAASRILLPPGWASTKEVMSYTPALYLTCNPNRVLIQIDGI